jgi:DNA-binding NarL/FixJ family response regulator
VTVAATAPHPLHRPPTSVLLIDDHEVVAGALQIALDREQDFFVCGLATTIERGLADAARLQPSLIITDLRLPDGDISDHLHRFKAAAPNAKVLIVTGWPTERSFLACIGASAAGYVSKSRPLSEVVRGARRVSAGEVVFPTDYVPAILGRAGSEHDAVTRPRLTARELDVLQLLARGHTTVEVSEGLCISVNTVRNHLASAMSKLGKTTRLAAVSEGVRLGLISPPSTVCD